MVTGTILDEIVATRRKRIESHKSETPIDGLLDGLKASDRDFATALRSPQPAFILECKKASPSRGLIREPFDLAEIAAVYGRFASAISVLTEPDYFEGSFDHLANFRRQVHQPVLCKDFIFDPWQVAMARRQGADAILLILAILDDGTWSDLSRLASSLGMATLTEISTQAELRRAVRLGAPIIGINNRDLRDMSVDVQRTRMFSGEAPPNAIVISESGYHSHSQIRAMADVANGFLVGTALMSEPNLAVAVKRLIFGDHKVCGLTSPNAAQAADLAGAVYGGAIFAPRSPRLVSESDATRIFDGTGLVRVGVFQDQPVDQVVTLARAVNLEVVQLHGDEDTAYLESLRDALAGTLRIWKALPVDRLLKRADAYWNRGVERLLVDTRNDRKWGGTGHVFDWSRLPTENRHRMMIAGGIGQNNVRAALALGAAGLDFNSALETSPGVKSPQRIAALFAQVRQFGTREGLTPSCRD